MHNIEIDTGNIKEKMFGNVPSGPGGINIVYDTISKPLGKKSTFRREITYDSGPLIYLNNDRMHDNNYTYYFKFFFDNTKYLQQKDDTVLLNLTGIGRRLVFKKAKNLRGHSKNGQFDVEIIGIAKNPVGMFKIYPTNQIIIIIIAI